MSANDSNLIFAIVALCFGACVAIGGLGVALGGAWERGERRSRTNPRELLADFELRFYFALQEAVGFQFVVAPKVDLAAIVKDRRLKWRKTLARRKIDFVVCDPSTTLPLLAIFLESSRAQTPSNAKKKLEESVETLLADAGIATLRAPRRREYDVRELEEAVRVAVAVVQRRNRSRE